MKNGRLGLPAWGWFVALAVLGVVLWCDNANPAVGGLMAQATTMLTKADNGNTVEVRVGDTIVLRLYESSSTGFRWAFNGLDTELVELVGSEYLRESEAVGSGGYVLWTLAAKAAGTTQVKLKLWRSWEGDASIQERFAVTLQIRR